MKGPRLRGLGSVVPRVMRTLCIAAVFTSLSLLGCVPMGTTGDSPTPVDGGDSPVADFALLDVNPTSVRYDTPVSPRDYIGRVTAWYFGHAT